MAKKKAAKKKGLTPGRCGNSGSRRTRGGAQKEMPVAQDDQAASALRSRYQKKLISELPPGTLNVEQVSETLSYFEEICESIAQSEDPVKREGVIRVVQAALLGAAEIDSRMPQVMETFGSFIRERVALVGVGRQPASPTDSVRITTQTATPPKGTPLSQENQALSDLRVHFLDRMMEVQRPAPCQQREDARTYLINVDRACDSIVQNDAPLQRIAMVRATQAAFQSIIEFDPTSQPFVGLLSSYMAERITLRIQSAPPFSDKAPRIVIRSLIIPGDRTEEGILVKGVSRLWFEIMRRIKDDPDSIHQIDCWKWEEILAGAYKQDGWDIVTLTPKRGDHGIDVIAERKGWGRLRFLLLDQMKAYKPGHLIGPDEIREMKGVLMDHPEASKGLITTTADFTPGALEAAANLAPRLELRPRDKLVEWMVSVAVEDLRPGGLFETEGPTDA